jgi:uncharacterized protein (DUF58 family)
VHTGDPFGLFNSVKMYPAGADLLVLPPTVALPALGLPASDLPGGSRMTKRAYHSTPSAAGVRDYMPGDPMNRIHWPLTARVQKIMIKEFELDPTSDIWIALDLEAAAHVRAPDADWISPPSDGNPKDRLDLDPTTEEYAVVAAASIAAHFIAQGRTVGFIAWGQHRVTLHADRGARQLVKILRALAVLRAEGVTPLNQVLETEHALFSRPDTLLVVTPSLSDDWIEALQTQVYRGIHSVGVIVEPGTFGAESNPMLAVSALAALNVPAYLVKRDVALDVSLHASVAGLGSGGRNLR